MQDSPAKSAVPFEPRRAVAASVARMPIFDGWNRVHGYQLAFWEDTQQEVSGAPELLGARGRNAHVEVEIVARGLPAFIPCPANAAAADWVFALPPHLTVLELEAGPDADELSEHLDALKHADFRIAVRGIPGEDSPLWAQADYIMVDAERMATAERLRLVGRKRGGATSLIALNVETQREFRERFDQGFDFFQGSYLYHPEPVPLPKIPPNRMVHLEILEELQKSPADLDRLSQLIKCDASLTYRLLKLVNSPLCATRQEITSIKSALLLLGENTARRFATMALAAEFNTDQPSEILRIAMERARFCELAAPLAGQDSSEQYLIGLISMFPAMLRIGMDDLVKSLPLRERTRAVLLGQHCGESQLIEWARSHEQGRWDQCERIVHSGGLNREQIIQRKADASAWADLVLFNAA